MSEHNLDSLSEYEIFELKDDKDEIHYFTKIDEFTNESLFYWACEEVMLNREKDTIVDFGDIVIFRVEDTKEHLTFSQIEKDELERVKRFWYDRVKNYSI